MTLTRYSFAITVFLGFILLSSPVTMTGAFAQQPENKIPSWIKNNAEWWADGSIDESSFIQGIQYLIKENIIDIPATKQGTSSGNEIPDWVKNNAGWWADGSIDESSFVSSMQYLIEEGVVQISSPENSAPPETEPTTPNIPEPNTPAEKSQSNNAQEKNNQNNKDKIKTVKDFSAIFNDEKFLSIAEKKQNKHDRMALEAATEGFVRVIVELDADFKSKLTKQEKAEKKQTIKNKQKSLKDILSSNGIIESHNLKYSPLIVMTVNPTVLDELISSGLVKTIHEDIALYPSLDTTVPIVGANIAPASDVTGAELDENEQETVVAILDSGIDNTHVFFTTGGSRIVFEGCYTGAGSAPGVFGCTNGENGTNAAIPCTNTACSHGTHVAGIAAGNHGGTDPSSGVASGVDIAAFQVFTVRPNSVTFPNCPANPSCMVAFLGDIVRALDSVTVLVNDGCPDPLCTNPPIPDPLKIVAVNMSFGTKFPENDVDECDTAAVASVLKGPIDILKADGVVSIASSGNRGHSNGMGSPACISSVVSVGSSDDFDVIPKYSNSADFLDLVAPGGNAVCGAITATCFNDQGTDDGIRSSIPTGNAFGVNFGTSMAAPHVTGAWALIKSSSEFTVKANYPDPSIAEILHVLKKTGTILSHPSTALTTPRIQIDLAINALIHLKDCPGNIVDIDNIIFGTSGDDKIYGTSDDDLIIGLDGNDFINGNDGNDCLFGGLGNDNISGGIGNDYLNGSKGNDNLNGSDGNDIIFGGIGIDHIDGGIGDDELHGDEGDDHITGRAGNDSLFGDDGNDRLDGGADGDSLNGGSGDDVILGRGGIDDIDGGDGAEDWCVPGDGEEVVNCELES